MAAFAWMLRLKRRGRPRIECGAPHATRALEAVAARFFCAEAESTDVTAVKEVLASTGMTLAGLRLGDRWLTLTVGYDPDALFEELLQ